MEQRPINRNSLVEKLIFVGSPLILGLLEIWHPTGSGDQTAFETIQPQVNWWITLHIVQLPLFGLVGLSVLILINDLESLSAKISRIAIGFFIIFYTALDSVVGIGSGLLIRSSQELSPEVQGFVAQQVDLLFFNTIIGAGKFSLVGALGVLGWLIGLISAAIAIRGIGVNLLPVCCLVLSGIFFGLSHTPPTGPIGMFCLFLAVILV